MSQHPHRKITVPRHGEIDRGRQELQINITNMTHHECAWIKSAIAILTDPANSAVRAGINAGHPIQIEIAGTTIRNLHAAN